MDEDLRKPQEIRNEEVKPNRYIQERIKKMFQKKEEVKIKESEDEEMLKISEKAQDNKNSKTALISLMKDLKEANQKP